MYLTISQNKNGVLYNLWDKYYYCTELEDNLIFPGKQKKKGFSRGII